MSERTDRSAARPLPDPPKRRGTGRTSRGRETRRLLLEAARTVFERDGFLQARVSDICDAAGISHGSFYTYFVSKEEIFKEVVDSVDLDLLTLEPAPADSDPIERIRFANEHFLRAYEANARIMRVIEQVATIDEEMRAARIQRVEELAGAIERRIRRLQEAGVADPEVDPVYAAYALGGMVAYVADYLFNGGNGAGLEVPTAADQLTLMWINSLGIKA